MELNREQIITALECCATDDDCAGEECPFYADCQFCITQISKDALALITSQEQRIKELTEENERLHASCTELTQECKKWQGRLKIECEYTEAITVRKIQDKFALEYGTYTDKDFTKIVDVFMLLDQIAKDMLEDAQ